MEMKDRGRAQLEISGVETPKYKGNPTVLTTCTKVRQKTHISRQ